MLSLKIPRKVALAVVATLVTLGVIVSFAESYRALYWWAQAHAVHGTWATIWPIQIDAFVAVGELALFVALVDAWHVKHRALPWIITAAGLSVSVAGNVGHVQTHDAFTRLTAAVPPLTAYVMLAAALGLLKRVVANQPKPVKAKPGPKPGTPRPKRDPEAKVKAQAFSTLPADEPPTSPEIPIVALDPVSVSGPLFRPAPPMLAGGGGPAAPQIPDDFDPDSTSAFTKLDANGRPVATNGHKR